MAAALSSTASGSDHAVNEDRERDSSEQPGSKKRKKNATMACNTCRRKRNRCIVPEGAAICTGCTNSGSGCTFAQIDKRRDGIQDLREKLAQYEAAFERLQSQPQPSQQAGPSTSNTSNTGHQQQQQQQQQQLDGSASYSIRTDPVHQPSSTSSSFYSNPSLSLPLPNATQSLSPPDPAAGTSMLHHNRHYKEPSISYANMGMQHSSNNNHNSKNGAYSHPQSTSSQHQNQQQQPSLPSLPSPAQSSTPPLRNHPLHPHPYSNAQSHTNGNNTGSNSGIGHGSHLTRKISGRSPDMLAVMDCLAVEPDGRIRAYGATSTNALAGIEDRLSNSAEDDAYSEDNNHNTTGGQEHHHLHHQLMTLHGGGGANGSGSGSGPLNRRRQMMRKKQPQGAAHIVAPPEELPAIQCSALVAAAANIAALPLGTDIRTVQHLLNLYFLWAWPMFPIISRQIFMQHFSTGGQYYSPLLLNALLALACHLSDWKVVRANHNDPMSAGQTFFDMAKSLLEDELERPSVTTVQALCLMAKREAYSGRPLRGGLYIAMCGRLVLDLGLHLDASHLVDRGILTSTDRYIRSIAFWGCWSVDKEYSAMVGRPCSISNVVITCPRPGYWELEDFDWWDAYTRGEVDTSGCSLKSPWFGPRAIADASLAMAGVHIKAMEKLHWTDEKPNPVDLSRALEAAMADARAGIATLPSVDEVRAQGLTPHVITLHMVYHCHIIIINRPFLFDDPEDRASRPPSATGGVDDTPRKRCFTSAGELVRLMDIFGSMTPSGIRPTLNCHQHNLVIAAAILIFQVTSGADTFAATYESRLANEMLQRAFALLGEMAEYRLAARQALANLKSSLGQRKRREARIAHTHLTHVHNRSDASSFSSEQQPMFDFTAIEEKTDGQVGRDIPFDPFATLGGLSTEINEHSVPSAGLLDGMLHAPLFFTNDAPQDDFSDLDSFLAQHSGYLYSADLLKDFPGGI